MSDVRLLTPDEQQAWLRRHLDLAVKALGESGAFTSAMIEVSTAWAAPGQFLIGRAREPGDERAFRWFISSEDGVFDHVGGDVADSARDAARHFSLKWQLDATKKRDPAVAAALATRAEFLYALVDDDRVWRT